MLSLINVQVIRNNLASEIEARNKVRNPKLNQLAKSLVEIVVTNLTM